MSDLQANGKNTSSLFSLSDVLGLVLEIYIHEGHG